MGGGIYAADKLRYFYFKLKNSKKNQHFIVQNPDIVLPPDYLMYESFQLDYKKYYEDSRQTAIWLKNHFAKYIQLEQKRILDWGCGPGRIIRHLPEVINNGCSFYGTDYNEKSIAWCSANIPDVSFNLNKLEAKLPYEDDFFDVIYGISIFTHLAEAMHHAWFKELYRVLKPGGILFLTTQGANFKVKLDSSEKARFEAGKLIVRGKVKEGHRTFSAFQPKEFMLQLFSEMEVLEHIELENGESKVVPQDIWIVRK
jgi:SAM-dependent methyltransferase